MRLVYTEEENFLRDTAQNFFADRMPVSHLRQLRDSEDSLRYSRDLWRQMAALGWAGILLPEELGGADFGLTGAGILMEEAGRTLAPTPLLSTAVLGASLLYASGASGNRQEWLRQLIGGDFIVALALDEQGWHDPARIETSAELKSGSWKLSGEKTFVADGIGADLYLVVARSGGRDKAEELSLFAVPADTSGLQTQPLQTADSRNYAHLKLDKASVPGDALLGEKGDAAALLDDALDRGRACLAAEMIGSAQQVFDTTLEYLRERKQFGVPIGSFQALQHRAARIYCELELSRSAVTAALTSPQDKPDDFARLASLAKAHACKSFDLASSEAVQMHGGMGVTDELDIGLYLKRARTAGHQLGDALWNSRRYADLSNF